MVLSTRLGRESLYGIERDLGVYAVSYGEQLNVEH